jgi:hypothetical protein
MQIEGAQTRRANFTGYRIEKGLFEAAVTSAEAALERSRAARVLTEIQLKRATNFAVMHNRRGP